MARRVETSVRSDMHAKPIASLDLLAVDASGLRTAVALRVGVPEPAATGEWQCMLRVDGLYDGLMPAAGEDSLQALCLALGLVASLLRDFLAGGGRLYFVQEGAEPSEESAWPIEAYFGWVAPLPR